MRYRCLVFNEDTKLDALPENERRAFERAYLDYDEELKKSGHFIVAEALEPVRAATSVRVRNGKLSVTDGPYAETKEQFGRFFPIRGPRPERRHPGRLEDPVGTHGRHRGASDWQPRGAVIPGGRIVRSHPCVRHA
jgi:hypothetical protein